MAVDTKETFDFTEIQQNSIRGMLEGEGDILHMVVKCGTHIVIVGENDRLKGYSIHSSNLDPSNLQQLRILQGEGVVILMKDDEPIYTLDVDEFNCVEDTQENLGFPY